jgi:hypothetical protein
MCSILQGSGAAVNMENYYMPINAFSAEEPHRQNANLF